LVYDPSLVALSGLSNSDHLTSDVLGNSLRWILKSRICNDLLIGRDQDADFLGLEYGATKKPVYWHVSPRQDAKLDYKANWA